jgi:transcriptional regulator with XRE-family HTH domain
VPTKDSVDIKARRCVAAWLKYKMQVRRMNIAATAQLMDVSPAAVSRVKGEKRTPGLDFVLRFSKTFDVPLEVLVYTLPPKIASDGTERLRTGGG